MKAEHVAWSGCIASCSRSLRDHCQNRWQQRVCRNLAEAILRQYLTFIMQSGSLIAWRFRRRAVSSFILISSVRPLNRNILLVINHANWKSQIILDWLPPTALLTWSSHLILTRFSYAMSWQHCIVALIFRTIVAILKSCQLNVTSCFLVIAKKTWSAIGTFIPN